MVAHLAARRVASGETSLDLRADGLTVAGPAATVAVTPGDAAALLAAVGRPTGPIRLDVFSNRHYAFAATTLAGAGLPFTELSVPAALRSADGRTWSAGFEQLVAEATNPGDFRAGLASLLAARDGPPTTGPGTASMPSSPRATLDRIAARASANDRRRGVLSRRRRHRLHRGPTAQGEALTSARIMPTSTSVTPRRVLP